MVEKFYICKKCVDELSPYGIFAVTAFQEICAIYLHGDSVITKMGKYGRGSPILTLLEKKQFIVSTEKDFKYLYVKPIGLYSEHDTDSETHSFTICKSRDKHENN